MKQEPIGQLIAQQPKDYEQNKTRSKIAESFNTNRTYVSDAKKYKDSDPVIFEQIKSGSKTIAEVKKDQKKKQLEQKKEEYINNSKAEISKAPKVWLSDCNDFLDRYNDDEIDCIITDPPYYTDVKNIKEFAEAWATKAISKVRRSGRLYICTGAYPKEIQAYLAVFLSQDKFIVDNPLIWTYRNTLGQTPKMKYNLNYQLIWHLYSTDSPELDTGITNHMFSVQEINAPDGRQADRIHTWQKPDELANRLITQGTKQGWLVVDPFVCTGTFLLAAARLQRGGEGADNDKTNLDIAIERGCEYEKI